MDPLSVTAGVMGIGSLPSIFLACLQCFELIQTGSDRGRDYLILETKLTNQQLRLLKWGEACRLNHSSYDPRLDAPLLRDQIDSTLRCVKMLFADAATLRKTYGMRQCRSPSYLLTDEAQSTVSRWTLLSAFKERVFQTQRQAEWKRSVKWVIGDKKKFEGLIYHLSHFIGDLEALTQPLGISERQQILVRDQLNAISDITRLENIEASRVSPSDAVSDAATPEIPSPSPSDSIIPPSDHAGTEMNADKRPETSSIPQNERIMNDLMQRVSSSKSASKVKAIDTTSVGKLIDTVRRHGVDEIRANYTMALLEVSRLCLLPPNPPSATMSPRSTFSTNGTVNQTPQQITLDPDMVLSGALRLADLEKRRRQEKDEICSFVLHPPPAASRSLETHASPSSNHHRQNEETVASSSLQLSTVKRLMQEMGALNKKPEQFVHVKPLGNSLRIFQGSMEGPPGSPYEGGIFHLLLLVPRDYPLKPPHCRFVTKIYHPNIDSRGRICLDILTGQWSPGMTLAWTLISIVSILDDPEIREPLVPEVAELLVRDKESYCYNARDYTHRYAKCIQPTKDALDNCLRDMAHDAGLNSAAISVENGPICLVQNVQGPSHRCF